MNCRLGGILTETASLALGLEQAENVIDLDCWRDVALAVVREKRLVPMSKNLPMSSLYIFAVDRSSSSCCVPFSSVIKRNRIAYLDP